MSTCLNTVKQCTRCKEHKPLDNFHKNKSQSDEKNYVCKPCCRDQQLKAKFNLSTNVYLDLLESQGGVCQICKCPPFVNERKNFAVDHDHSTGKVRGILCSSCNTMLGNAKDNISTLQNAISYLSKYA